jgi:hypothetical protein
MKVYLEDKIYYKNHTPSFLYSILGSSDPVKNAALIAGIVWALPPHPKQVLEDPITTTLNTVIYGSLCMWSATHISEQLPTKGKWIFAGLLGASTIYQLGKNCYNLYKGRVPTDISSAKPLLHIEITHSST